MRLKLSLLCMQTREVGWDAARGEVAPGSKASTFGNTSHVSIIREVFIFMHDLVV